MKSLNNGFFHFYANARFSSLRRVFRNDFINFILRKYLSWRFVDIKGICHLSREKFSVFIPFFIWRIIMTEQFKTWLFSRIQFGIDLFHAKNWVIATEKTPNEICLFDYLDGHFLNARIRACFYRTENDNGKSLMFNCYQQTICDEMLYWPIAISNTTYCISGFHAHKATA